MAIKEFGYSLLKDVRARKDQQVSDQRKEDRREEKRQLFGEAAKFGLNQIGGVIKNSMEKGTADFLGKSNLYDVKNIMGKAENSILEYNGFKKAAEENGTSFENQVLRDTATRSATELELTRSNSVLPKNQEAIISYFMRQEDVIELAKERTGFFTEVGTLSQDYLKGKNTTPLQTIVDKQTPTNVFTYALRKIAGKQPEQVVFNAEIEALMQVQAANKIVSLKTEAIKNAVFEGALTPDEARIFMPELEQIQKDPEYNKAVRLLDTTELMDTQTGIHFEGNKVFRKELSRIKDFRGNTISTGFQFVEIKDIDLTKPLTTDDLVKMSGEISDMSEHASKVLNAQGFNDYSKAAAALLRTFDGKIGTEYLLAATSLFYSQKFTDPKNYKADVSPEKLKQMYFLEEEIIKATSQNLITLTGRKNNTELLIEKWKRENPTLNYENDRADLATELKNNNLNLNAAINQRRKQLEKVRASYLETTTVTPKTSVDLTSTEWATSENWAVEEDDDGTRRLYNTDNNEFIYFLRGTNKVQDSNGVIRTFTAKEKLGVPTT